MNIWSAIVRIVEIFVKNGRPGHALSAFIALMAMMALVALGMGMKGQALADGVLAPSNLPLAAHR